MKRNCCVLFFISFLITLSSFAQINPESFRISKTDSLSIEKLKHELSNKKVRSKFETYSELIQIYLIGDNPLAQRYAEEMYEEALGAKNQIAQGHALYFKGKSSDSEAKALEYYKQSATLLEKTNDDFLGDIYYEQSQILNLFSEFPAALRTALKSLKFNQNENNGSKILRDMSHIGYIYDRMYDFEESIKWNRDALKLAKELNDRSGEALCYGRIGIAYDELAEKDDYNPRLFDSALYYNKKAARLSELNGDLSFARTTYSNIGNTYSKLKDYEKAEEYTLKSLAVPGFEERKGVTLVNLGKIYLETNRYDEAKKILDSAMKNTVEYGTRKYQLEAYYRFHELDVKKGDYKSALQNYIAYKRIEDSLLNETKTLQIAEMGERFKSAEKEREILVQRADLAERDVTIQRRNYQLYGALGIAIILGALGYLFYNQQKLKNRQLQKENQLKDALVKIETQNRLQDQRLRISRDLHDNIGAQLTFIISSIDNLKYGFDLPNKLDNKLSNISTFATTTIYELRDTIWAMNKSEISLEDLQSRISNFIEKAKTAAEGTDFRFEIDENLPKSISFSSLKGINIYRIIQEAVHNAIKYSEAHKILVCCKNGGNRLSISVIDDGNGFDIPQKPRGNGILNMKKRAREIEAEFSLDSEIGSGTTIQLIVPIFQPND